MPAAQRELMEIVERIVRPVPMSPARKMRIRKEFLEHLEAGFAEELAVDQDEAAALERARRRFGDPAMITTELRAGLCLSERFAGRLTDIVSQRRHERLGRYVARVSAIYACILAAAMIVAVVSRHLVQHRVLQVPLADLQAVFAADVSLTMLTAGLLLFGVKLSEELISGARRRSTMFLAGLGLVLTYPAAILVLLALSGGMGMNSQKLIWNAGIGSAIFGFSGILLAFVFAREAAERRCWEELSVDAN